jgi:hypothetical protein
VLGAEEVTPVGQRACASLDLGPDLCEGAAGVLLGRAAPPGGGWRVALYAHGAGEEGAEALPGEWQAATSRTVASADGVPTLLSLPPTFALAELLDGDAGRVMLWGRVAGRGWCAVGLRREGA